MNMAEYRLHRLITYLFFPSFIAALEVIVFAPFSKNIVGSLLIGFIFFTIYPTIALYKKYLEGEIDLDVSNQRDRTKVYLPAIASIAACSGIFWLMQDRLMLAVSVSYLVVTTALFFLNMFSKISTHTAGLAGPITAVVFYFGIFYAPLYLLLWPVAYARFKLGMHNRFQLALGVIVGAVLTYAVFSLVL